MYEYMNQDFLDQTLFHPPRWRRHRDERVNSGERRVDAGATGREWRQAGKRMEIDVERWGHKGRGKMVCSCAKLGLLRALPRCKLMWRAIS